MAYKGNRNLLSINDKIEYTQEQLIEYAKCAEDPFYFIDNYYKIVHVDHGLIPFKPYPYQREIAEKSHLNRFHIVKLPRQSGKTTIVAALILWYVLFHQTYNVLILAHKQSQSHEILSRIKTAYENLPQFLQQPIKSWNTGDIELGNGSAITAEATAGSAGRGGSYNLVYLDEFAFVPANLQEEFFASVYPVISSGQTTKVLITSTPKGMEMFFKIWTDSELGRNSYVRTNIHWSDTPGRDEKWKEETIRNTSERQFAQEFETEFLGSSSTLISGQKLRLLVHREPLKASEYIRIYEEPEVGHTYLCTVDTSRGLNQDYSAYSIFDITTIPYRQVMTYRNNNITPYLYPNFVKEFAEAYNNALILAEVNDLGGQVVDILYKELEYEHMLFTAPVKNNVMTISGGFSPNTTLGLRTTKQTKRVGCASLKTLVESDKLLIHDYNTIYELQRFVSNEKDSYEAEEGETDDLVMCCVLFAWAMQQQYMKDVTNQDIRQNLFDENARMIEEQLTPFDIYDHNDPIVRDDEPLKDGWTYVTDNHQWFNW